MDIESRVQGTSDSNYEQVHGQGAPKNIPVPPTQALSSSALPSTKVTEKHLELEARVHGILRRMASYLTIPIPAEQYPTVEFGDESAPPYASCCTHELNHISIIDRDFHNGYAIGEELAHWLHLSCCNGGTFYKNTSELNYFQKTNVIEFVGFLGREIARQSCQNTEYEALFPFQHPSAAMNYDRTGKGLQKGLDTAYRAAAFVDSVKNWERNLRKFFSYIKEYRACPVGAASMHSYWLPALADQIEWIQTHQPYQEREVCKFDRQQLKYLAEDFERIVLRTKGATIDSDQNALEVMDREWSDVWHSAQRIIGEISHSIEVKSCFDFGKTRYDQFHGHAMGYLSAALWLERHGNDLSTARVFFESSLESTYENVVRKLLRAKWASGGERYGVCESTVDGRGV